MACKDPEPPCPPKPTKCDPPKAAPKKEKTQDTKTAEDCLPPKTISQAKKAKAKKQTTKPTKVACDNVEEGEGYSEEEEEEAGGSEQEALTDEELSEEEDLENGEADSENEEEFAESADEEVETEGECSDVESEATNDVPTVIKNLERSNKATKKTKSKIVSKSSLSKKTKATESGCWPEWEAGSDDSVWTGDESDSEEHWTGDEPDSDDEIWTGDELESGEDSKTITRKSKFECLFEMESVSFKEQKVELRHQSETIYVDDEEESWQESGLTHTENGYKTGGKKSSKMTKTKTGGNSTNMVASKKSKQSSTESYSMVNQSSESKTEFVYGEENISDVEEYEEDDEDEEVEYEEVTDSEQEDEVVSEEESGVEYEYEEVSESEDIYEEVEESEYEVEIETSEQVIEESSYEITESQQMTKKSSTTASGKAIRASTQNADIYESGGISQSVSKSSHRGHVATKQEGAMSGGSNFQNGKLVGAHKQVQSKLTHAGRQSGQIGVELLETSQNASSHGGHASLQENSTQQASGDQKATKTDYHTQGATQQASGHAEYGGGLQRTNESNCVPGTANQPPPKVAKGQTSANPVGKAFGNKLEAQQVAGQGLDQSQASGATGQQVNHQSFSTGAQGMIQGIQQTSGNGATGSVAGMAQTIGNLGSLSGGQGSQLGPNGNSFFDSQTQQGTQQGQQSGQQAQQFQGVQQQGGISSLLQQQQSQNVSGSSMYQTQMSSRGFGSSGGGSGFNLFGTTTNKVGRLEMKAESDGGGLLSGLKGKLNIKGLVEGELNECNWHPVYSVRIPPYCNQSWQARRKRTQITVVRRTQKKC